MIKMLYRVPQPVDAVSFYRGLGVLGQLRNKLPIDFVTTNDFNWHNFAMVDLLYIVRPSSNADKRLIEFAKNCGCPVWIDYDDNILKVPIDNIAHNFYADKEVQANVKYALKNADVVSVSTEYLAYEFNRHREKPCVVIPNAFNDKMFDFNKPLPERKKIISWRGSRTHDRDLGIAHQIFKKAQEDLPDWSFTFLGEPDWRTQEIFLASRFKLIPSAHIIEYFHTFHQLGSTLHAVPLIDNDFNRSKSNIAWIEASFVGAVTVGPNMPEWQKPGVINTEWFLTVNAKDILRDPEFCEKNLKLSREFIFDNLLLSKMNSKRVDIIETLL